MVTMMAPIATSSHGWHANALPPLAERVLDEPLPPLEDRELVVGAMAVVVVVVAMTSMSMIHRQQQQWQHRWVAGREQRISSQQATRRRVERTKQQQHDWAESRQRAPVVPSLPVAVVSPSPFAPAPWF